MSKQQLRKKTEGFTIIEILIVLAIAGLILLIVFLAIPQIRRNQANTAMRSEVSRILSAAVEFESNSNGQRIDSHTEYRSVLKGVDRKELSTTDADHTYVSAGSSATALDSNQGVTRITQGTCNGTALVTDTTLRSYAVQYGLVGGGTGCAQS